MSEGKFDPSKHLSNKVRGGAEYLEVKWRLVWLRSEHPDAAIATELVRETDDSALFKASVNIPGGGSATGFGSETAKDFGDFIEKAETKAVGRALAMLGYGTQFTGLDLDEGERIVDAPVDRPAPTRATPTPRAGATPGREPAPRGAPQRPSPSDRPAAVPSAAGPPSQLTAEEKAEAAREMFGRLHTLSGMDKLADKLARDGVPRTLWGDAYNAALARLSKVEAVTA